MEHSLNHELLQTILDTDLLLSDKLVRVTSLIQYDGADVNWAVGTARENEEDTALCGTFPILLAVAVGQGEVVELLVRLGADVNQELDVVSWEDAVCPTALHQACLDGRLDLVQILMTSDLISGHDSTFHEIHLEVANYRLQTPYHLAVESGNTDLVGYLAEHGSVVDACDSRGNNALHMACTSLCSDRISYNTLCNSSSQSADGREDLEMDSHTNLTSSNALSGNSDDAAVCINCVDSSPARDMVAILLDHGVSIYQRNHIGFTPVRLAALMGKEACARLMLAQAWRLKNICDTIESTTSKQLKRGNEKSLMLMSQLGLLPLEAAVAEKNVELLRTLLRGERLLGQECRRENGGRSEREVDQTKDKNDGVTRLDESLHIVVLNPQLNPMLKLLLCSTVTQSSLNGNSSLGYTPLYCACANRNSDAVEMLLLAGADPDKPSQRQYVRPLKKSILLNDLMTARRLLQHGASACHCPRCVRAGTMNGVTSNIGGTLLRGQYSESPVTLVGIRDYDTDLLHLALFTDIEISKLLIAAGTCVSEKAENILASSLVGDVNSGSSISLLVALYEAGWTAAVRRLLNRRSESNLVTTSDIIFRTPELSHLSHTDRSSNEIINEQNQIINENELRESSTIAVLQNGNAEINIDYDSLYGLTVILRSPDSLRQSCRCALRQALRPRILWAVHQLPIPDIMKRYIILDCC